MANSKKYASLSTLQTFLDNLKNLFASKMDVDELSNNVAYINEENNENIMNPDIDMGIVVDGELSEASANPIQNQAVTKEINEINEKISGVEYATIATDDEIIELLMQEDMFPVVTDIDGNILSDENGNILLW